jgi:NAD(P)-dependent dehydrogenase (short-subunit alcohol dehydrogenase family)
MTSLRDRVVVVTGAGGGIGRGIAEVLTSRGAVVVIAESNTETGTRTANQLTENGANALFVQTDVTNPESVSHMVQQTMAHYGRLDGLVNNVGVTTRQPFEDITATEWERVFSINLTSMFHCVQACLPHLRQSDAPAIVNITSVNATATIRGMAAYPATKAGIIGLTQSLAIDLAPQIRVNAVAPGVILTEAWERDVVDLEAAIKNRLPYIPRKRVGQPQDVGKAVAFLLSDDADFITGTVLRVDGGMLVQLYAEEPDA